MSTKSSDEFYSPVPEGYKKGKTKYVIITGSVISGLGKGIFTSSIGKLFVDRGLKVAPIKLEAYLNVDSGTLNPFRHGEVFVLDDGFECDMDLGSYERFIDMSLTKESFVTSGRIYKRIIEKERRGEYLGRDVQFIPHVTGEAKKVLRELAVKSKADVIVVEIGGTVGDYENMFFLEAVRQLRYEEGEENVAVINLTYILEPSSVGEFKSKAAQLGIKRLIELGIQPDIIVCRSQNKIPDSIKEKISISSNVPVERVIGSHDVKNIYEAPLFLRNLCVDEIVLKKIKLDKKFKLTDSKELIDWTKKNMVSSDKSITVGIAGKYTGLADSYISILKALEHSSSLINRKIEIKWIETTAIEKGKAKVENELNGIDGLIVPGGFGTRGAEGKIECIKFARENNIPFLGLCYGMQLAVVEFARNKLNLKDANSTEINPKTSNPIICILPEQEEIEGLGGTMRLGGYDLIVEKNSLAFELYGKTKVHERFRHRFNVNPSYIESLESKGMKFSGRAPQKKIMQIMELPEKEFFLGTQFHPEFTSRPLNPNPLFLGFAKACKKRKEK
ncbi:MAG: CTP synthase (glutamine hydrolyzing) [Candidatus Diapherotrites archaeon]|nr:CTP synthase (glutamine hydrolyzing) [Candidatus Diapherotrites archaeon]